MNLPNKLTVIRVIMIPFFIFFYLGGFVPYNMIWAFLIFVVAAFTDTLDGKIARKHNLVTNFGKLMDPLADKLLVSAAMILILGGGYTSMLAAKTEMSPNAVHMAGLIVLIVVTSRDLAVNSIRLLAANNGVVIAADKWGKIKTVSQMVWIVLVLLRMIFTTHFSAILAGYTAVRAVYQLVGWAELGFYYVMIAMTVVSGFNYIWKNRKMFADA